MVRWVRILECSLKMTLANFHAHHVPTGKSQHLVTISKEIKEESIELRLFLGL